MGSRGLVSISCARSPHRRTPVQCSSRWCGEPRREANDEKQQVAMTDESITISPITRIRIAMILAIIADALQVIFLPLFVEGAESPANDALDLGVGAALVYLLGWH